MGRSQRLMSLSGFSGFSPARVCFTIGGFTPFPSYLTGHE